MKAIIRTGAFSDAAPTVVHYHTFGIDDNDILIFRDEAGEVIRIIKHWHDVEFLEDDPCLIPDDAFDRIERKRGYCDC